MADKKKTGHRLGQTGQSTVPGLEVAEAHKLARELQSCLNQLNELQLNLKHAHWNVVGPRFIGVHTMLDPQVDGVRAMVDVVAERMAAMGVAPIGTPGEMVRDRDWEDYPIGLAQSFEHLGALNVVYSRVIENHRRVIEHAGEVDPVTEDMLIGQVGEMELYQWFIRAHLTDDEGTVATDGIASETQAAREALASDPTR